MSIFTPRFFEARLSSPVGTSSRFPLFFSFFFVSFLGPSLFHCYTRIVSFSARSNSPLLRCSVLFSFGAVLLDLDAFIPVASILSAKAKDKKED